MSYVEGHVEDIISKIDRLLGKADADRTWFITGSPDGLLVIEDGRRHGMFPVKGEAFEIELIVELHNAWPAIKEALLS